MIMRFIGWKCCIWVEWTVPSGDTGTWKLNPESCSNSLGLVELVPFEYESQYESKSLFWSIHPQKQKTAQSQVELPKFTDDIAYNSSTEEKLCIAGSRIDVRIWLSVLDYSDEHCEYHYPDAWLVFMVEEGSLRSWCLVTFLLDEGVFYFSVCVRDAVFWVLWPWHAHLLRDFSELSSCTMFQNSQSAILPQFSQKTCNIWMINIFTFPRSFLSFPGLSIEVVSIGI